jgi:hypothetical protein
MDSSPADHHASIHVKRLQTYINLPTNQGAMLSLMFSDSRVGPHRQLRAAGCSGPSIGARAALAGLAAIESRKPHLRGLRALRINRKVEKGRVAGLDAGRSDARRVPRLELPHGEIAAKIEIKRSPIDSVGVPCGSNRAMDVPLPPIT